ncbi:MAG: PD-(D/E)XK nuclease family protein [Conexivisphaera sp.]
MALTQDEKLKFLRAIEEDREFRHAVAGAIGYGELLERFARIEERQNRLEEKFAKLEERFARIEERQNRLEEKFAKLEERFARIEERQNRLEEQFLDLRRLVTVIAHRFGAISEGAFREGMKYVVQEVLGSAKVSRLTMRDDEGIVYGHPSEVEVDVLVRDSEHVLVEVKSRVSKGDVAELAKVGELYFRRFGVKPRLLIIGGYLDRGAGALAQELGVELRSTFEDFLEP